MSSVGLTLLSAVLYAAAFPPVGGWPLAWIALAPWFYVSLRGGPLRGAALGALFGLSFSVGVASWLPSMLESYFGLDVAIAYGGSLAIAAGLMGIPHALFGAWLGWLGRHGSVQPWIVAAGFCALEFARVNGPVENPWALAAYTQLGWTGLMQSADLAGPYLLSLLIGVTNALLAAAALALLRSDRPSRSSRSRVRQLALSTSLAFVAFALVLGYGWRQLERIFGGPQQIAVGALQLEAPHFGDAGHFDSIAGFGEQVALTTRVLGADDLVVWPEFTVDFPLQRDGEEQRTLLAAASASGADLLVGAPHVSSAIRRPRLRNSVFLVRAGQLVDRRDKVHLMPWGETNPLPTAAAILPSPRSKFGPGHLVRPMKTRAGSLGVLICSEALYPGHARELANLGAEVFANPSNDMWFGDSGGVAQVVAALRMRAIENRRYLVRSSRGGPSLVVDPHGRVVASAGHATDAFVRSTVRRSTIETTYQRHGDVLPTSAGFVAVFASILPARRSERREA